MWSLLTIEAHQYIFPSIVPARSGRRYPGYYAGSSSDARSGKVFMPAIAEKKLARAPEESRSSESVVHAADAENSVASDPLQAIRNLLQDDSSNRRKNRKCKACGAFMEYLDAYCWLPADDAASIIQLPFCPTCNPDVLTELRRRGGAQRNSDRFD